MEKHHCKFARTIPGAKRRVRRLLLEMKLMPFFMISGVPLDVPERRGPVTAVAWLGGNVSRVTASDVDVSGQWRRRIGSRTASTRGSSVAGDAAVHPQSRSSGSRARCPECDARGQRGPAVQPVRRGEPAAASPIHGPGGPRQVAQHRCEYQNAALFFSSLGCIDLTVTFVPSLCRFTPRTSRCRATAATPRRR